MPSPRCLLVTGRLAEPAMRAMAARLQAELSLDCDVEVLPISVAALMHADWVRRKLTVPEGTERVLLPGWCQGDVKTLSEEFKVAVELGPKDLQDLPEHFTRKKRPPPDLSVYDIEILAEINHAPRLDEAALVAEAELFRASGADVIDLGCIPGETWSRAGDVTRALRDRGLRVSIDSFTRADVEAAVANGAELVLSCNSTNIDWAAQLSAELVAIPDDPHDLSTLEPTIERLTARGAKFRIDPILEPIGFGFSASLGRYLAARRRWPDLPIMMGIGNLTELTEVDSAGVNMLLAGFCQEQRIGSVLTTEVIPWCRTAVREFDIARRIVAHALRTGTLPKHVDPSLVMLRDPKVREQGVAVLEQIAAQLRDPNYRIFAEEDVLHIMNRDGHHQGTDPFELFDRLKDVDPSHAFYLGYELAKAMTALTLGKQYTQDEALNWGFLTRPEESALHRRKQSP